MTKKMSREETLFVEQQIKLRDKYVLHQYQRQKTLFSDVSLIAGVDISFFPPFSHPSYKGVGSIVIVRFPDLKVLYEHHEWITHFDCPYIPGLLGFREVPIYLRLIEKIKTIEHGIYVPDVILVDGSGEWHPRHFGSACHLGVLCGIPTIGVSKNLLDADGLDRVELQHIVDKHMKNPHADKCIYVHGKSGRLLGAILGGHNTKRLYISVGYAIDLDTCVQIIVKCQKFRIPEPIRQADLKSREIIRTMKT